MPLRHLLALLVLPSPAACSSSTQVVCATVGHEGWISVDLAAVPQVRAVAGDVDGRHVRLARQGPVFFPISSRSGRRVAVVLRLLDGHGRRVGGGALQVQLHETTFGSGPCAQRVAGAGLTATVDGSLHQTS